jgi:hypothetical protein
MVPMALALERGSQMQAPLGRAVIGGLVFSTAVTLLIVPAIFAIVIGRKVAVSPSLSPADPESAHYDPESLGGEVESADHPHGTEGEPADAEPQPGGGSRDPAGDTPWGQDALSPPGGP